MVLDLYDDKMPAGSDDDAQEKRAIFVGGGDDDTAASGMVTGIAFMDKSCDPTKQVGTSQEGGCNDGCPVDVAGDFQNCCTCIDVTGLNSMDLNIYAGACSEKGTVSATYTISP